MPTSGTFDFTLDLRQMIEEAYSRCGLVARSGTDVRDGRRSLDLLLIELANRGMNFWKLREQTESLPAGQASFALNSETVDLLEAVIRQGSGEDQTDLKISRVGRDEFFRLPNKNQTGRPTLFWVDRGRDAKTVHVWPVPDQTYALVHQSIEQFEDAGAPVTNTIDSPWRFLPALVAGLAYKVAQKKAPHRMADLKMAFEEEWGLAQSADRERVSVHFKPNLRHYR